MNINYRWRRLVLDIRKAVREFFVSKTDWTDEEMREVERQVEEDLKYHNYNPGEQIMLHNVTCELSPRVPLIIDRMVIMKDEVVEGKRIMTIWYTTLI